MYLNYEYFGCSMCSIEVSIYNSFSMIFSEVINPRARWTHNCIQSFDLSTAFAFFVTPSAFICDADATSFPSFELQICQIPINRVPDKFMSEQTSQRPKVTAGSRLIVRPYILSRSPLCESSA